MQIVEIIKQSELSVYLMETHSIDTSLTANSLTQNELLKLKSITHPEKKIEFLVSRHLRTEIFGKKQILYTETGAPYIDNNGFISISHTNGLVGISYSPDFKVGLDLECIRDKAAKLSDRFVHQNDTKIFDTGSSYDMSLLWSAKETLFKLAGRKAVIFAEHLWLEKEGEKYSGFIAQPEGIQHFSLAVHEYRGKLITCNTSEGKFRH